MSLGELLVTLLVALLVFGPKQLPMVAYHLGKCWRRINEYKQQLATLWHAQWKEHQLQENTRKAKEADASYEATSSLMEGRNNQAEDV